MSDEAEYDEEMEQDEDVSTQDDARDDASDRHSSSSRHRQNVSDDAPEPLHGVIGAAGNAKKLADSALDGEMNPYKAQALAEKGVAALNELQAQGGKLDAESAIKLAKTHTDATTQKLLDQAENVAKNGVDVSNIASLAAASGMPMNEHMAAFVNAVDEEKKKGKVDYERIQKLPGMIVDPKTGDVNLFGLMPVPAQYASMLAVGYSIGISLVNRAVFGTAFKGASSLVTKLGAAETIAPFTAGKIAGYSAIAFTTHWPDFSIYLQSERAHKAKLNEVCNEMAPILDTLKGNHDVRAFYAVTQQENEIVYNERQRVNTKHNAERFRNGVQAAGRATQFLASAMDGREVIQGLENAPGMTKVKNIETYYADLAKKAKEIEQASGNMIKGDKAIEEAKSLLGGMKTAPKMHEKVWENSWSDWRNVGALGFTLLSQGIGQAVYEQKTAKLPEVSAYRMIMTLRAHLDEDSKQAAYPLPKGMRVAGVKGSASDELPLEVYVYNIFQRHEEDCIGENGKVPSRLHDRLIKASTLIADDLRTGKLDSLALVNLVGERRIVRNNGKFVADEKTVRRELDALRGRMRHIEGKDGEQILAESSYSKDALKKVWDNFSEEEKNYFVSLEAPQALEAAGVNPKDIKQRRQAREKQFDEDMTKVLKGVIALGDKKLKDHNITDKEIALLHEAHEITNQEGAKGIFQVLPGAGRHTNVAQPLVELVVSHAQHGGKLSDLIQRGAEV